MIFTETKLKGAYVITLEPVVDNRGFFARTYCRKEFESHALNPVFVQCNISYNKKRGTLRGMHYQVAPYEEAKLISCIRGAIYDVIIDLRPDSPTYCQWMAIELAAPNHTFSFQSTASIKMLYVPEGFAHGFQTLVDDTEVFYHMSEFYHPESAKGIRWDDPLFAVQWPLHEKIISDKDKSYDNWTGFLPSQE